jgi:hypothetical protein
MAYIKVILQNLPGGTEKTSGMEALVLTTLPRMKTGRRKPMYSEKQSGVFSNNPYIDCWGSKADHKGSRLSPCNISLLLV